MSDMTQDKSGKWVEAKPLRCPTWIEVKFEALVDWFKETFTKEPQ